MRDRNIILLKKILKYCLQVDETENRLGNSFDKFKDDFIYQNSCCMCLLQIGELCKLLDMEFRKQEYQVPWRQWCGIRDIIAHQYEELDIEIVWSTLREDLPFLKGNVQEILKKMEEEQEDRTDFGEGKDFKFLV